jgi:hypothetical protein
VDVVCDALARRMKGIVEASRKEALRQRDAGVAPPDDKSEGSAPEDLPDNDEEGVPEYMPEEIHGQETTACSKETTADPEGFGVSRTEADLDSRKGPSKGKEKVGHPSDSDQATLAGGVNSPISAAVDASHVTPRDAETAEHHSGMVTQGTPASAVPSAPEGSSVEARQLGKRKASFSSGRATHKVPRVVAYVDSSSGDEGEGNAEENVGASSPMVPTKDDVGGSTAIPRAASSAELPETDAGGSGSSPHTDDPAPESMLRAMASGRAYIGEDHWSHLRTGSVSDRLCNFLTVPLT